MLDHVVLATPDLEATIAELTARLGVAPSVGGPHVGLGTRNVLYSLGGDCYLEVIGPDAEQPEPDGPRPLSVDDVTAPTIVTWCAKSNDLAGLIDRAAARGRGFRGPVSMSRRSPHGLLEWACAYPEGDTAGGLIPFFIDWGSTAHPSTTSATGLTLKSWRAGHPDPDAVTSRLAELGVDLAVDYATAPRLSLIVNSPNGTVEIGT